MDFDVWFQTLWEVLQVDEDACISLIRRAGGHLQQAMVNLVEGDVSALDAVNYARTLAELGLTAEGREVLWQALSAAYSAYQVRAVL